MSDERDTPAAEQAQSEPGQDTGPFFQMPPPRPETSEMDALDPATVATPPEEHAGGEQETVAAEPEPAPLAAEPEPAPVAAEPEPVAEVPEAPAIEPEPVPETPEPAPEPSQPEPVIEPIPAPSEPDPVPAAPSPEPEPAPVSEPEPIVAATAVAPAFEPASERAADAGAGHAPGGHPEIIVGLSFAGGLALAILLKRLAT